MLYPGVTVIICGKRYEVVRGANGSDPCTLCGFVHLEKCAFPCSQCDTSIEERLIPVGYYLRFCEKLYKPGQLVTIGKHVYRICKVPCGKWACPICCKTNGGFVCNMSDYKPYSCTKYTYPNYYLQLIK